MKYRVIAKPGMPKRAAALLSREREHDQTPASYDLNAPGLYPDETVVELDTGEKVAVSVENTWLENNGGVALIGFARWLKDDGSTLETRDGKPVETNISCSIGMVDIEQHGLETFAGEVAKLLLGEEPTMVPVHVDTSMPQFAPGQDVHSVTHADPEASERPLLPVGQEVLLNSSVRVAIKQVRALERLKLSL